MSDEIKLKTFNCFITVCCSASLKLRLHSCLRHTGRFYKTGETFKNAQSLRPKPVMFLQSCKLINSSLHPALHHLLLTVFFEV